MAQVITVPAHEDISVILDILQKDGCIVLSDVLSDSSLKTLQKDLAKAFEKVPDCQGDFYGYATKRMSSLFKKSKICQDMAVNPQILSVMDHFLLKGCSEYQINLTQAIAIGSGEMAQIIHQDDPMFPFMHPDHEAMINCMWAVDDFTIENGATYLVPGSHLWPRNMVIDLEKMRLPQPHEITQGVMKAGSVLIYLGSLYHSGGQNSTGRSRTGAVISYALGWLRQAENSYLAYSREEVSSMPERLQRLLGYFVHAPNLGCVEGQDPIKLVQSVQLDNQFVEFIPDEAKALLKSYRENQKKAA